MVGELSVSLRLPDGALLEDEELHLETFDEAGRVTRSRHDVDTAEHIAVTGGEVTPGE